MVGCTACRVEAVWSRLVINGSCVARVVKVLIAFCKQRLGSIGREIIVRSSAVRRQSALFPARRGEPGKTPRVASLAPWSPPLNVKFSSREAILAPILGSVGPPMLSNPQQRPSCVRVVDHHHDRRIRLTMQNTRERHRAGCVASRPAQHNNKQPRGARSDKLFHPCPVPHLLRALTMTETQSGQGLTAAVKQVPVLSPVNGQRVRETLA